MVQPIETARTAENLHPAIKDVLQFFQFDHLQTGELRDISKKVHDLAWEMALNPNLSGPQLTLGLHDLLRAKDCFVRAAL